ncbi:hypothetical protein RF11_03922 [Thelohanellus kitauei]|uniref:CCHC-type domain-containing protein n=1 Tax=Thelohanellus kitauei TaxID=669202 RepID=A0A0C2J5B0_THEKT|nr:hypothetical protein RF11_03922 [Thelohanellus kitauei]
MVDAKELYRAKSCSTVDASFQTIQELKKEIKTLTEKVDTMVVEKKSEPCCAAVTRPNAHNDPAVRCHYCGKLGHIMRFCKIYQREANRGRNQKYFRTGRW